jgi:phycocyanobilin:ferredoxin oxidoreductase
MQPKPLAPPPGQHPLVHALAASIRSAWAELPGLEILPCDEDLRFIQGQLDGEGLSIGNELFRCIGLRKLHLEVARLGNGLQILHSVWFPDPHYDLPIFGADIVTGPAGVSAAIVDLSPTSDALPEQLIQRLEAKPWPAFRQVRDLPAWGSVIFSNKVCFIRPDGADEEAAFLELVSHYLQVMATSVMEATPEPSSALTTVRRYEGQLNYCLQQKRNDKTRRVLEKAFDSAWADRYIDLLLFDNPPEPR